MDISICYFSGTGNTAWVVERLGKRLDGLGDVVQIFSCEEIEAGDRRVTSGDALGLAFPVHSSWAPGNFRGFIAQLPQVERLPLFVVVTAAYGAGDAAWYAARPLQAKGYAPFLYANVFMPNNLLYPVPKDEQVQRIVEKAGRKVDRLASLIHERRRHIEGVHPWGWLIGLAQRPAAGLGEVFLSRRLFADETCSGCNWCAEHCPTGNIQVTGGRVHFADDCVQCMRCFHHCPQQAIQCTRLTRNEAVFRRYLGPNGRYRPPRHALPVRE
jgi:ferredoxin/flavodoxin